MSTKLRQIQADLQDLSQKELKAVIATAKFLLSDESEGQKKADHTLETLFYGSLSSLFLRDLKQALPPYKVFKNTSNYKYFKEAYNEIESILNQAVKGTVTRQHRQRMYHLYGQLVFADLRKLDIPITMKNVANAGNRFATILDDNYPFYAQSGLLHLLLTKTNEGQES